MQKVYINGLEYIYAQFHLSDLNNNQIYQTIDHVRKKHIRYSAFR